MFRDINILEELKKEKGTEEKILKDVDLTEIKEILLDEYISEKNIVSDIFNSGGGWNKIDIRKLESGRIFDLNTIKKIAIKYRLRFIPAGNFRSKIPYEALISIKALNRKNEIGISNYKILAPSRFFDLRDAQVDPLLFAPLSNGKFYLIHKWGDDLKWYRKLFSFPLRSIKHMLGLVLLISSLLTVLLPVEKLVNELSFAYPIIFEIGVALFLFSFLSAITIFCFFTFLIDFSKDVWDKNTYNN